MKGLYRLRDLGQEGVCAVLHRAAELRGTCPLAGKTVLLIGPQGSMGDRFAHAILHAGGEMRRASDEVGPAEHAALCNGADAATALVRSRAALEALGEALPVPLLNAGDDTDAPLVAVAELVAALDRRPEQGRLRVAWTGSDRAGANAWIEAALYVPFELFMFLPPDAPAGNLPDKRRLDTALQAGALIFLSDDSEVVLDGAHVVIGAAGTTSEDRDAALGATIAAVLERLGSERAFR